MGTKDETPVEPSFEYRTGGDRRVAGVLLLLYLAFILYGSFFPFHFSNPSALKDQPATVVLSPWTSEGRRVFSIADLMSNILLGMPLGLLLVLRGLAGSSIASRLARVAALDVLLAGSIEIGQLFAPGRTTSLLDVGGQVAGSMGGAIAGHLLLRTLRSPLGTHVLDVLRRQPSLAPLALLVAVLAADALYPYALTLDVSSVRQSAKAASWVPLGEGFPAAWHATVVERLVPYALLAALLAGVLRQGGATFPGSLTLVLGAAVALGLELGKLFIEGRSPAADPVLAAIIGLLAGLTASRLLGPLRPAALTGWVPVLAAGGLLAYEELAPFDMISSVLDLRDRIASIEWAPFASYYSAVPQAALFDAGKKILLGALFGGAIHAAGWPRVSMIAFLVSALLEIAQLFERSHHPALTDVLLLSAGAVAGCFALRRYREIIRA
jgi:VanZ family protein